MNISEKYLMNIQMCLKDIPNMMKFNFVMIVFWEQAIQDELSSHYQYNALCLVPRPNNKNDSRLQVGN